MDLSVELCGLRLKNPLMLASGILGSSMDVLERMASSGAAALVTKSISTAPREGYPGPTVISPMENVYINAMGLPNPGYREFFRGYRPSIQDVPVIPSVFGSTPEEFRTLAGAAEDAGAPAVELNLSCPHSVSGLRVPLISQSEELTASVVEAVRESCTLPVAVKLTPNVADVSSVALAAARAGASAVVAVNTLQAAEVDPYLERPVLGNMVGGLSGPALRPVALRKVLDIAAAFERAGVDVPVVGVGGICSGEDAARFILAGCTAVQVGTCLAEDPDAFRRIESELRHYMDEKGYSSPAEFRGNALRWLR